MCGNDCRASSEYDAAMLRCHCSKCIALDGVFEVRIECETHLPACCLHAGGHQGVARSGLCSTSMNAMSRSASAQIIEPLLP